MEDRQLLLDDDQDLLNDETFGGDGDGGDYDWEAGAPPPDELFKFDQPSGGYQNQRDQRDAYGTSLSPSLMYQGGRDRDHEDQDCGYMNVEESISRLVQDDEDVEHERDIFVKVSHRSLMPPQVITRNLNLLSDKELGSNLFGNSVWAMNPTDVLQGNVGTFQQNKPPSTQQSSNRPPPGVGETSIEERLQNLQEIGDQLRSAHQFIQDVGRRQPELPTNEDEFAAFPPRVHDRISVTPYGHGPPPPVPMYPENFRPPMGPGPMRPPTVFARAPPGMPGFHYQGQRFPPPPHPGFMGNRGPLNFLPPRPQHQFPHHPMNQRFRYPSHGSNGDGGDRNAGLMTEKDKQRLRNIQMLQLQNDHPYTTDFYFQMKKYKATGNIAYLKRVFPTAAERPTGTVYEPTRFDNALGKLQAVSALAPKRVIDTYLQVPFTSVHDRKSRARVLRGIEEVQRLYLDIKEFKYRRAGDTVDDEHDHGAEFRTYSNILDALDVHRENLSGWLLRKKGRVLLYRLIEEFVNYEKGKRAGFMIFTNLLKYSTIVTMQRMEHDEGLMENIQYYYRSIMQADVILVDLMLQGIHPELFKGSFGVSMYLLIMERAADLVLKDVAPINWTTFSEPLVQDPLGYPVLNINPDAELTGFGRFPSMIKCFLDCDLRDLARPIGPVDVRGKLLEDLMNTSYRTDVVDYGDRRRQVFGEFQTKPNYILPDYPDSP